MKQRIYNAALYCRLSRDDEQVGESSSIGTQRTMLRQFATEQGFHIVDEYVDDGWSGTNFDRPGFQRMIDDIEEGKINCVITKDLSRLGRNYILTGQYTEIYFPAKNVRYIAISDNVDSNKGESDIAPFRNILNEMVARDTSTKVRAAMKVKFNQGEFIAPAPPIGYIIDPEQKNRLIIDDETRYIPERIFELAAHGKGPNGIARQLYKDEVSTPSWFRYKRYGQWAERFEGKPDDYKYQWNLRTVRGILLNEAYIGNIVHYTLKKVSFKSKKNRITSEDEWMRIDNTHEPIISKDLWNLVQSHMDARKRSPTKNGDNIFARLLFCGECGWSLSLASRKDQAKFFHCTKYSQRGKDICSMHYTPYKLIYGVVLSRLQYWLSVVSRDESAILDRLLKSGDKQREAEVRHYEKELKKAQKRKSEVHRLFMKVYEDNSSGRLDDENYAMLREKYRAEQLQLAEQIEQCNGIISKTRDNEENVRKWIDLISKYTAIDELTAPLLNELIEKILVHDIQKDADGNSIRDIEIYYRFVGKID